LNSHQIVTYRVTELRHGWTSAQELRHKFQNFSLTSAHIIILHYAEVKIPMKLAAKVTIRCRSPQDGAEVIPCRSYYHSEWNKNRIFEIIRKLSNVSGLSFLVHTRPNPPFVSWSTSWVLKTPFLLKMDRFRLILWNVLVTGQEHVRVTLIRSTNIMFLSQLFINKISKNII